MFRILLTLVVIAAIAAFASRPTQQEVQGLYRAKLMQEIARNDTNTSRAPAENAALALCKVSSSACADLIVSATQIIYVDRRLFAQVTLKGLGKSASCLAMFTQLTCTGDMPGT